MTDMLQAGPEREPAPAPAWLRRLVPTLGLLGLVVALAGADAAPYPPPAAVSPGAPPVAGTLVTTDRRAKLLDLADGRDRPLPLPGRWAGVHALDPLVVGRTVVLRLGPERGEASGAHNRVVATGLPGARSGPAVPARALGAAEWVTPGHDDDSVWLVRRSRGARVAQHVRLDGAVLAEPVPLPPGTRVLADTAAGLVVGPVWPNTAGPVVLIDRRTGAGLRTLVATAFVQDVSPLAVLWSPCRGAECPLRRTELGSGRDDGIELPEGVRRTGPAVLAPDGAGVAMPVRDARGRAALARGDGRATAWSIVALPAGLPAPTGLVHGRDGVLYGFGDAGVVVLPAGSRRVHPVPGRHPGLRAVAAG